jgi:hypothetical protein
VITVKDEKDNVFQSYKNLKKENIQIVISSKNSAYNFNYYVRTGNGDFKRGVSSAFENGFLLTLLGRDEIIETIKEECKYGTVDVFLTVPSLKDTTPVEKIQLSVWKDNNGIWVSEKGSSDKRKWDDVFN